MKVIIWGYPLYSHTHSYIHAAFYKAFKYLGYDVYWFHDNEYPEDFDWNDCVFWTEGFADKKIPLNKTSTYFVHVCPDPAKYINAGVKKFVDVRPNGIWQKDHVYDFTLDKSKAQKLGPCVYLVPKKNRRVQVLNDHHSYWIEDYDKMHVSWATNSLPEEFDLEDIHHPRENKIWFSGNLSSHGVCENYSAFRPFLEECKNNNIEFIVNDPWANPLNEEEVKERTMRSILGVDIRGPEHLRNGYIPCRVFKSISWGHLGTTNSDEVNKELEGHVLFQPDTRQLYYDAMDRRTDYDWIRECMLYVKENHTYVNRINAILKYPMKEVTIVSALFNIERENMDGRKWDEYLEWFDITLKLQCPMYLFVTEDVREFVEERRTSIPTEIIVKTESDLPYYHLNDRIQGILDDPEYRKKMSDPNRIECKHSMYSIIQYSKFPWLVEAAKENPFNSNYFFWLDAGGSRFFEGYGLDGQYPGNNAMESLNSMGESFLVQENCDYYPDLFNADQLPSSYLYDNRSFVLGSMFGGHKNSLEKTAKMVDDVLMNEMIGEGSVNNEQIALGYLLKNNPDHFAAYQRKNGKHMDIFRELSQ